MTGMERTGAGLGVVLLLLATVSLLALGGVLPLPDFAHGLEKLPHEGYARIGFALLSLVAVTLGVWRT